MKYVSDAHTSKASKRQKVVLLYLWRIDVKTTGGFINIPVEDFHLVKTIIILRTVQSSYAGRDNLLFNYFYLKIL